MEGSLYTLTWQCQVACAEDSFILTRELQMGWGSVHGEAGPEDSRRRSKCKSYGVPVRPHAGHRAFLCSLPPDLEEPRNLQHMGEGRRRCGIFLLTCQAPVCLQKPGVGRDTSLRSQSVIFNASWLFKIVELIFCFVI